MSLRTYVRRINFSLISSISMPSPSTGNVYPLAVRAQVVSFRVAGLTNKHIVETTGVSLRQIQSWYNNALKRGYDPSVSVLLKDEYLVDAPRSGRPKKAAAEVAEEVKTS
jgi:transposase